MVFYVQPTSSVISGRVSKLVFYTQSTSISARTRRRRRRRRRKQRREKKKENKTPKNINKGEEERRQEMGPMAECRLGSREKRRRDQLLFAQDRRGR